MLKKPSQFYGTGRRKTSSARVFVQPGKGLFVIKKYKVTKNKGSLKKQRVEVKLTDYFSKEKQIETCLASLKVLNLQKSYNVFATVKGGGFTGQAEALRHGLSRALLKINEEEYRPLLKKAGFLTRDSRMVERKKYGHHKARKSTQFSKR